MKLKLSFVLLSLLATSALAAPMQQAGDIAEGASVRLKTLEMASYYKDGNSGTVTFRCYLWGDGGLEATLMPGKNFESNRPAVMGEGSNGPYTWTLHSKGFNNGNIKVTLLKGGDVEVQCQQVG